MRQLDKKIAIFIHGLTIGGAERVNINLANGFAAMGIDVDLIVMNDFGGLQLSVDERVNIINLHTTRALFSLPKLITYLFKSRPKALISAMAHTNIVAIIAGQITSTSVIATEHSTTSILLAQTGGVKSKIIPTLMRYFYPKAHSVVAVSSGVYKDLKEGIKINSKNIHTIFNPIIPTNLEAMLHQPPEHDWLINKEAPVVIGIGRLVDAKQFDILIRAFALLVKKIDARLIIFGEGEKRAELEKLISQLHLNKKVSLPGFAKNPYSALKHADLFVLSSKSEGLPTVLVEALACGCPVVSTNCKSGPDEILDNGRWGRIVEVGDIEMLSEAMLLELGQPSQKPSQNELQKYTLQYACKQYLSLVDRRGNSK